MQKTNWQNKNADKIEIVDFAISEVGNMNQFFYQITRKASELINSDDYRKAGANPQWVDKAKNTPNLLEAVEENQDQARQSCKAWNRQ